MGHKVGTMACKSSVYIDIDQPESTPLLLKKNYQAISTPKKTCDSSIILLSCFLIVGSLIGLYLLLEQGANYIFTHILSFLTDDFYLQIRHSSLMFHFSWLNGLYLILLVQKCFCLEGHQQIHHQILMESFFLIRDFRSVSRKKCARRSLKV